MSLAQELYPDVEPDALKDVFTYRDDTGLVIDLTDPSTHMILGRAIAALEAQIGFKELQLELWQDLQAVLASPRLVIDNTLET